MEPIRNWTYQLDEADLSCIKCTHQLQTSGRSKSRQSSHTLIQLDVDQNPNKC